VTTPAYHGALEQIDFDENGRVVGLF
jgi:hypothetical protein